MSTSNDLAAVDAFSLSDYEELARARLPAMVYAYIAGGAGDERTLGWNDAVWNQIKLRPRVLTDVATLDTRVTLWGYTLSHPILLAPTAYHRVVHPSGECETARGASAAGAILVVSTNATVAVEEIAACASEPFWFQLYVQPDRGITRALVERAEAAGARALCVTVDTAVLGARNRQQRARFALPPDMALPHKSSTGHNPTAQLAVRRPSVTWDDIAWLRSFARVPVVLKGILDPDDAQIAVQAGASGIIVSNHGARNLDTLPSTAEALPLVAERVAGRVPVLVDGGVRRGTDVLKALALGASAVLVGRPYLYGLAVDGAAGVARVVEILRTEFEMALALTGRASVAQVTGDVLWPPPPPTHP